MFTSVASGFQRSHYFRRSTTPHSVFALCIMHMKSEERRRVSVHLYARGRGLIVFDEASDLPSIIHDLVEHARDLPGTMTSYRTPYRSSTISYRIFDGYVRWLGIHWPESPRRITADEFRREYMSEAQ